MSTSLCFLDLNGTLKDYISAIKRSIRPLIKRLQIGETPGDRIQETDHIVYKVRLPNSSARRGKSGGFRAIYYLITSTTIYLLTIYSKTDQSDIPSDRIRRIIEEELRS